MSHGYDGTIEQHLARLYREIEALKKLVTQLVGFAGYQLGEDGAALLIKYLSACNHESEGVQPSASRIFADDLIQALSLPENEAGAVDQPSLNGPDPQRRNHLRLILGSLDSDNQP